MGILRKFFFPGAAVIVFLSVATILPAGKNGGASLAEVADPIGCQDESPTPTPAMPEPAPAAMAPATTTTAPEPGPTLPPRPKCTPAAEGTKPAPGANCDAQNVLIECVKGANGGGGSCTENDQNRTCKIMVAVKDVSTCAKLGLASPGPTEMTWGQAQNKFKTLLSDLATTSEDFELLRSICTALHELTHCFDSCRDPCERVCKLEQNGSDATFTCLKAIFDAKKCPMPSREGICKKLAQAIVESTILKDVNACACRVDDANNGNPKENQKKCVAECINGDSGCVALALKRGYPPQSCIRDFCTGAAYAFCPQHQRLPGCGQGTPSPRKQGQIK